MKYCRKMFFGPECVFHPFCVGHHTEFWKKWSVNQQKQVQTRLHKRLKKDAQVTLVTYQSAFIIARSAESGQKGELPDIPP